MKITRSLMFKHHALLNSLTSRSSGHIARTKLLCALTAELGLLPANVNLVSLDFVIKRSYN
jgi:hypothetical protein